MVKQCLQRRVRGIAALGKHDRCGLRLLPDDDEKAEVFVVQKDQGSNSPGTIGEIS
jgi:hypothetical protein